MQSLAVPLVLLLFVVTGPDGVAATCTDPTALGNTRAAADQGCEQAGTGCTSAHSHGEYVSCVRAQAKAAVEGGTLPAECKGAVVRCAAKSTCGKPGFVTCCRTKVDGTTTCSIKRSGDRCTGPRGGTACVSGLASCCDACSATGCAATTTTTTIPCRNVIPDFGTCSVGACPPGQRCTVVFAFGGAGAFCDCANEPTCSGAGTCSGSCPAFGGACVAEFGACVCQQ